MYIINIFLKKQSFDIILVCQILFQASVIELNKNKGGCSMKNIIFLFALMLVTSISVAQQAQKNLLKTFDLNSQTEVVLNLDGDVNIERWNNSTLRVQMDISYENASVHIMKYMISKGRYNLVMSPKPTGLVIEHPNKTDSPKINKEGELLKETIVYTIVVPQGVTVIINEGSQTNILNKDEMVAAQ